MNYYFASAFNYTFAHSDSIYTIQWKKIFFFVTRKSRGINFYFSLIDHIDGTFMMI